MPRMSQLPYGWHAAQGTLIVFLSKALCSHCGLSSLIASCYRNLDKFWHLVSHLTHMQNLVIPHSSLSTEGTLTGQRRNFPELTCFWHLPDKSTVVQLMLLAGHQGTIVKKIISNQNYSLYLFFYKLCLKTLSPYMPYNSHFSLLLVENYLE